MSGDYSLNRVSGGLSPLSPKGSDDGGVLSCLMKKVGDVFSKKPVPPPPVVSSPVSAYQRAIDAEDFSVHLKAVLESMGADSALVKGIQEGHMKKDSVEYLCKKMMIQKNEYVGVGRSVVWSMSRSIETRPEFQTQSKTESQFDPTKLGILELDQVFNDFEKDPGYVVRIPEQADPGSPVTEKTVLLSSLKKLPETEFVKKLKMEVRQLVEHARQQLVASSEEPKVKAKVKSKDPVVADDAKGPIIQHAHPQSATASPSGQTDRKSEITSSDNSRVNQKAVKNMGKRAVKAREAVREGAEKVEKREVELERDKKIDTKIKKD